MSVFVELNGRNRIEVAFPFDRRRVESVRSITGRRWQSEAKVWTVPLDLDTCHQLREKFGEDLVIGPELKRWARREAQQAETLGALAVSDTAELSVLPKRLPYLAECLHVGPLAKEMTDKERKAYIKKNPVPSFQYADVMFMALSDAPLNTNEPGMGKTVEAIGAVFEAELDDGPVLVVAPKTSIETVWRKDLERFQPNTVLTAIGEAGERDDVCQEAMSLANREKPFWLVVNPAMFTFRSEWTPCALHEDDRVKVRRKCERNGGGCKEEEFSAYPELLEINWRAVIVDECHQAALGNAKSKTGRALSKIKADKTIGMSGTPFGGKPLKLFNLLQFMQPKRFTSKWHWADRWLETEENEYGKTIGGLRPDVEEEFWKSLTPYITRRTKAEEAKYLPPKDHISIEVPLTGRQKKQYRQMEADAEVRIDGEKLATTGILDEYMRLKQFANAHCTIKNGKVVPTTDSVKLPVLLQILEERGISATEPEGDGQVVVFSQFKEMVDMIYTWLNDKGIPTERITSEVKDKDRFRIVEEFQKEGGPRVLVMTTTAGGVAITLDRASTVVIMDETWNPDNQIQAEDRVHRMSKIHQVTVYRILTEDTIETSTIAEAINTKGRVNNSVLDKYRKQRREEQAAA